MTGKANTLWIFEKCACAVVVIEARRKDGLVEMADVVPHRFSTRRIVQRLLKPTQSGAQTAHDLDGVAPILPDLIECESEKIFPVWRRKNDSKRS